MLINLLTKPRLKSKIIFQNVRNLYSSDQLTSIKNQALLTLQSQVDTVVPSKPLLDLLKLATSRKLSLEPQESLLLIQLLNPRLIDLFPSDRQANLNTLFKFFLTQQDTPLSIDHFFHYMSNTTLNKHDFNPVRMSTEITNRNLSTDNWPAIHGLILEQLCKQNKISLALLHLKHVLDKKSGDLKKAESSSLTELYEDVFSQLKNISSSQGDLTCILNGLLVIKPRDEHVQKRVLEFIRPDEKTHFFLINSHLDNSEYSQAAEILSANEISPSNLFSLYSRTESELVSKLVHSKLKLLGDSLDTRVAAINTIMDLCKVQRFTEAVGLVRVYFPQDLNANESEPTNTAAYLCKSLVEFADARTVIDVAKELDAAAAISGQFVYLRKVLYYSNLKANEKLSVQIIDELKQAGAEIQASYFHSQIASVADELAKRRNTFFVAV